MVSTSTVKKSAAARPSQCAARNVFQGVFVPRSGAGSTPWSLRSLIVLRATSWPETLQPAADACVAPGRVLGRHAYHERGDVRLGGRATGASRPGAVVLLGDEPPIPTGDGVGSHDSGDVREAASAEDLAFHGQTAPLVVG